MKIPNCYFSDVGFVATALARTQKSKGNEAPKTKYKNHTFDVIVYWAVIERGLHL